jgi:hypothetical protein
MGIMIDPCRQCADLSSKPQSSASKSPAAFGKSSRSSEYFVLLGVVSLEIRMGGG